MSKKGDEPLRPRKIREPKPSVARERLLEAALLVFAQSGFKGASIRDITRLLGMRASSFYAHFASKQAAYDALFEEGGPAVVVHGVERVAAEDAPDAALRRLAEEIMESWAAPRARLLASIVLREVFSGNSSKRKALLSAIGGAQRHLARLIRGWQARGAMRRDVSPNALAFEFLAPLVIVRILHYNQASTIAEQKMGHILVKQHTETFLALVRAGGE